MKQLLQNMRDGKAVVAEVPCPAVRKGAALVCTAASLVSAGTERMVVEFAEKSILGKARSRPDLVRQVLDKARREGIVPTLQATFNRLDQPMALGYSSAGTVVAVGEGLLGFKVGDRVACAGGGYAVHAEYAVVPQNLLAKIPEGVDFESAAFATVGAIALHGFRLAAPQVGESVAVIGLGLLGLLSVGIARAAGCRVFGVDLSPARVELARQMGAQAVLRSDADSMGASFSQGRGFDVVLICADARSNDPIELAGVMARDRGRVVAVGAVGLNVPRKVYYEKELSFQVSRSYGPGRYDPAYEERGQDYPLGFVRWTEGRNLQAILDLLGTGQMDVKPLITQRYPIAQADQAYELITGKTHVPFLGVLLTYPHDPEQMRLRQVNLPTKIAPDASELVLGVLGAGNYATAMFLPAVQSVGGIVPAGIATATGLSARHAAKKFGYRYASSDENEILDSRDINVVAVLTRHNQHARQVLRALRAGKSVYCEKPLAIRQEELDEIAAALANEKLPLLMVGFNRRFAPLAKGLKAALGHQAEPMVIHYRVNAGYLPLSHWTQDPDVGGGRIIGEGCHFIDFMTFLTGSVPVLTGAQALPDAGRYRQDNVVLNFSFADGSLGTLSYLANGDKAFPKERVEVFRGGCVAVLDDFRRLEVVNNGRRQVTNSVWGQDKGHRAAWASFLDGVVDGGTPPIAYEELIGVTQVTLDAVKKLMAG